MPAPRADEYQRSTAVLTEVPPPHRLLLWLLLRGAALWGATADPDRRARLFRPAALRPLGATPTPPAIATHVTDLVSLLGTGSGARPAESCWWIARWAQVEYPATALLFAETAAALQPQTARLARDAGLAALRCGEPAVAKAWLRRAVALARRQSDWLVYARSLSDLAEMHEARGEDRPARTAFLRSARAYRRRSLTLDVRARAALGLFRLALRHGPAEDAERFRQIALRTYPSADREAAAVRIAVARSLLEHRHHWIAIAVLEGPQLHRASHEDRVTLAKLLARAAAGADDPARLERAWAEAVRLLGDGAETDPAAILQLAQEVLDAGSEPPDRAAAARVADLIHRSGPARP